MSTGVFGATRTSQQEEQPLSWRRGQPHVWWLHVSEDGGKTSINHGWNILVKLISITRIQRPYPEFSALRLISVPDNKNNGAQSTSHGSAGKTIPRPIRRSVCFRANIFAKHPLLIIVWDSRNTTKKYGLQNVMLLYWVRYYCFCLFVFRHKCLNRKIFLTAKEFIVHIDCNTRCHNVNIYYYCKFGC